MYKRGIFKICSQPTFKSKRGQRNRFSKIEKSGNMKFSRKLKKQHTWHDIFDAGQNFVKKSKDAYSVVAVKEKPVDPFTFPDEFCDDERGIHNPCFDDEITKFSGRSKSATCLLDEPEKYGRRRYNTDPLILSCSKSQPDMSLIEFHSLELKRRNAVSQENELERIGLCKYLRDYVRKKRLRDICLL